MDKDQQETQGMEIVGMVKGGTVVDFFHLLLPLYCFKIKKIHEIGMHSYHGEQ